MFLSRTRYGIFSPVKRLLKNSFKIQCSNNMFNYGYETFTYRTIFHNIQGPLGSLRPFCTFEELKVKTVTITFLRHDGFELKKEIEVGKKIQTLFDPDGDEIPLFGQCDGSQACGTCHILLPRDLVDKMEEPEDSEIETVCCANGYDVVLSRLACCVDATEEMDGVTLLVPKIIGDKRNKD